MVFKPKKGKKKKKYTSEAYSPERNRKLIHGLQLRPYLIKNNHRKSPTPPKKGFVFFFTSDRYTAGS